MKKIICILMIVMLSFSFVACSSNEGAQNIGGSESEQREPLNEGNNTESTENKVLVVYFSATGSTRTVAENIAQVMNADIFELVPQSLYTNDDLNWNNESSRVSVEHADESKREVPLVSATPDDWESYETVFVGYPIWWGIAAWPVGEFIENNDFTGKKVVPFCTSASSGVGDSANLLKESSLGGEWMEGKRFSSGASMEEVEQWLKEINIY